HQHRVGQRTCSRSFGFSRVDGGVLRLETRRVRTGQAYGLRQREWVFRGTGKQRAACGRDQDQ
ncbi:MAG: hypothetical protein ACREO3_07790, partial [Arenimonas sp.]